MPKTIVFLDPVVTISSLNNLIIMRQLFIISMALFAFGMVSLSIAEEISRESVIRSLTAKMPSLAENSELPPQQSAPADDEPSLKALQKLAGNKPDPELLNVLFNYILVYRAPGNPLPAAVLGRVFYEQPDAFIAEYSKRPAAQRLILLPYLTFGFQKTVEDKNPSLPRVVEAKKKWERLNADAMNARSRDDVPAQTVGNEDSNGNKLAN